MLPEQVSERWDKFAPVIEMSLPPTVTKRRLRMANVLRSILMDELVIWVYQDESLEERFVLSTLVQHDPVSLVRNLLIYSFTGFGELKHHEFLNAFKVIRKYAKSQNCESIIAYTQDEGISEVLERLIDANNDFSLIQVEV